MNNIRILCALVALSGLLIAQSTTPSAPTTRPRPTAPSTSTSSTSTSGMSGTMSGTQVTLPSGTAIEVRVNESLSSDTTPQGERFTGTLTSDVTDPGTGRVVIPRDAEVTGRVLSATPSGRLSDSGELQLTINTIRYGSSVANVAVEPFIVKGESHTKSNTTKIGGGAALGAIIGAIAGGGKGAAIGAGVGGAAGAGTAAATGKRPAEVKPEALIKFLTSGETTVTAANQMPDPGPSTSSSTIWPAPSRPASTTQSTTTTTAPASSDSSTTTSSDNPDAAPVLRRPDGSIATPPSPSTDNGAGTAATPNTTPSTTTTASSGTYGTSNPPAASSSGTYGSTPAGTTTGTSSPSSGTYGTTTSVGAGTAASTTTATTPSAPTTPTGTTTTTSSLPDSRLFSARDRRVVNQCLKDNAASLPPSFLRKSTTGYQRGQTLSSDVQRQLRSLPLTCDRELPAVNNDLERVVYGGQVLLIDSSNRVLDVFDVAP